MIQIYHNSRCGKSRNCVLLIENSKQAFEVIHYLKTPPSFEELSNLIQMLNIEPINLVRQKEKIWIENFKNIEMNDQEIIRTLIANPILIERPILVKNERAIIGRDLEKITYFIS
ncbi:arsenate reductase [Flavobacterium micromati]|uniref:Arsenate reductase n=1 Tax=Flavobacterium micromati TaxID=229205 RepID=A0A1M5INS1_9FLAO|nr:ArsC/Spx/MgsR family protein [Flavobacterium micromati]MCL6461908.1 arsenate reductase [Flavobacterium micromati]SHG29699.1 arsenate reductase [Flavobacterium micromati]